MSNKKKLDPRTVRADGRGMTKEQRAAREEALGDAMLSALTAMNEKQATEWRQRVDALREGLSTAAIKRAGKRASKRADDHPPGHIEAMGSMDLFEEVCADYGIDTRDVDTLWGAVAQICMFQLAAQRGPFHRAAEDFGLTRPASVVLAVSDLVTRDIAARKPVCDCPNCRPRTAEELN